jgi:hypothetical protein
VLAADARGLVDAVEAHTLLLGAWRAAKKAALDRGTTLTKIVEDALRSALYIPRCHIYGNVA